MRVAATGSWTVSEAGRPPQLDAGAVERARTVLRRGRRVAFARGDVLLEAGMPPAVYYLAAGCVKLAVPQADGGRRVVGVLGPGAIVGEVPALAGHLVARTTALTPVDAYRWTPDELDALLDAHPDLARLLLYSCAIKAHALLLQVQALTAYTARQRVLACLVSLVEAFREGADAEVTLPLPLTQADLASLAAVSRVTVNQVLGELREQGLLAPGRELRVRDVEALRRELPAG